MIDRLAHVDDYTSAYSFEIGCIRIAAEEFSLAPAPVFAFGPIPDHLNTTLFGGLRCNAIGCYIVRNGQLGYDAVLFHNRHALWSTAFNHGKDFVTDVVTRTISAGVSLEVKRVQGSAACIYGPGYNVYGHWLVDILPRLGVLAAAGYDIEKLRYIFPFDCPGFGIQLLESIGIPQRHLLFYNPKKELTQIDELIVPTNLRTGNRLHSMFARATRSWVHRVAPEGAVQHAERRLFVSRQNVQSERRLDNRNVIEDLARTAGFDVIYPECLPLVEQIALFRSARQVIGEYGSGLHSTVYGGRSLHCCALRGTSHWLGFVQSSLSHAFQQTVSYVFGHAEPHAITYKFEIEPENFCRALDCLEVEFASFQAS